MGIQVLTETPMEKGTIVFTIVPTDEDDTELSFSDLTNPQWQLMKTDGTVVNGRTFAASSMTSLEFVLSGDDLAIFGDSDRGNRVLSFYATYDSTAGSDLPLVGECTFNIQRVLGQVDES
jgi:hypothetical protein